MKTMVLQSPIGLDRLIVEDCADLGEPCLGEIRVALHGSSLNFQNLGVATGRMPNVDGRIPLADGAEIAEAVGTGVTEFGPGNMVVSCFFPEWQDGPPTVGDFHRTPGDGIDGFAREYVVMPATAFTRAPKGFDAVEAATIMTAGLTAWRGLVVDGRLKAGDTVLLLGTGGVSIWALQIAKLMGAAVAITSSSDENLERGGAWVRTSHSTIASGRIGDARCAAGWAGAVSIMWSRSDARARCPSRSTRSASAAVSR